MLGSLWGNVLITEECLLFHKIFICIVLLDSCIVSASQVVLALGVYMRGEWGDGILLFVSRFGTCQLRLFAYEFRPPDKYNPFSPAYGCVASLWI